MALPRAGELNRRIQISEWQDKPVDDAALKPAGTPVFSCWAKVVPASDATYMGSVQIGETVTHRIIVRRVPGMTTPEQFGKQHLVACGREKYLVRKAQDLEGARRFTLLSVELTEVPLYG